MAKLIIAPTNLHQDILKKYRQDNPFNDVKIISKESLIGEWLGRAEKGAINYLMKKHDYSYDNAKVILPYLPYLNEKSNLYEIKKELIDNHLFIDNSYLKTFFERKETLVIGYSSLDKELISLFNYFHLDYQFEKKNVLLNKGIIKEYETVIDEVFYTLNEIAHLIDQGIDINNIYIIDKNNEYNYYLEKFSNNFGFSIDLDLSYPLFNTSLAASFLKEYISSKNVSTALFEIEDTKDKELLEAFKEVINNSIDEELSFEQQLSYFLGELKTVRYGKRHLNNVVRVIDKPIYKENAEIFVLGFAQGIYPESNKDNSFLSDKEKELFGMNTSLDKTLMSEDIMQNFFSSNNHFHFSFSHRSLAQKYFISPWKVTFNLDLKKDELPETIYSKDMADFYFAKALDLKKYYSEYTPDYYALKEISDIPYGIYDNSYTGVNVFNEEQFIPYSYSQINTFYQCPFEYYLSRVLNIDPFEGNFSTKFGSLAHEIFEHQYDKGFDFNVAFEKYVKEYEFTPEEYPILENLRKQIKEASDACRLHMHYMNNPRQLFEKDISVKIGPNSMLRGKIDKSIILNEKYLAIVDYKTGSDSFNASKINEGLSLQLPTYCLLAESDNDLKQYPVMGVFINNVIDTSLSHEVKEGALINPYYRLNGKVVAEENAILDLDNTFSGGKPEFIKGVNKTKDGQFSKNSNALSSFEEIKEYARVALDKYKEADARIRHNDFPINPQYQGKSDNACTYCTYRDICYVRADQRRYLLDKEDMESEDNDDE